MGKISLGTSDYVTAHDAVSVSTVVETNGDDDVENAGVYGLILHPL